MSAAISMPRPRSSTPAISPACSRKTCALAGDILSDILQNSLFDQERARSRAAGDRPGDRRRARQSRRPCLRPVPAGRLSRPADRPHHSGHRRTRSTASVPTPSAPTWIATMSATTWWSAPPATSITTSSPTSPTTASSACKADGAPAPQKAHYVGGEERLLSDHEQAHIVLGFEGRAYNSDGFYAAQVLASILGGGMSSRLFQEVREKRGLCYSVYAFHWAFADSGIFGVAASTGEDQVDRTAAGRARRAAQGHRDHHRGGSDPRPQPDPRRPADVARKPVLARRPAGAPADPLGPPDPAAGNGRSHQPHHRRPGEAGRAADLLRATASRSPASARSTSCPTTRPSPTSSRTSLVGDGWPGSSARRDAGAARDARAAARAAAARLSWHGATCAATAAIS